MRVSLYGAGQVGSNVAAVLGDRAGITVAGPYRRAERDTALGSGADVVVIATASMLCEVAEDIGRAIDAGSNVITTAEEAAFPWSVDPALADDLDARARRAGVSVMGAGVNPGYIFDAMVLTALGATWGGTTIAVERSVDLSRFSTAILRRLGIGFPKQEFFERVADGRITGHVGFPQSMRIVARRLGLSIERIDRFIDPILTPDAIALPTLAVAADESAGFVQRYVAIVDGSSWFTAHFTGHIAPSRIELASRDEIAISGPTPLRLVFDPGVDPQVGATALVANSIERIIAAPPGWCTVADLPPAAPRVAPGAWSRSI